jgi:hypothetical protein
MEGVSRASVAGLVFAGHVRSSLSILEFNSFFGSKLLLNWPQTAGQHGASCHDPQPWSRAVI